MKPIALIAAASLTLAACAQHPNSIAPVAMPGGMYDHLSCDMAAVERSRLQNGLDALESRQLSAVAGDAIGVALLGVPTSSLFGGDVAGQIAAERGKLIALDARLNRCGG